MSRAVRHLILLCLAGLPVVTALAHDEELSDWAKYRHGVMHVMQGHIVAVSLLGFGKVEDTGYLQSHADGLAQAATEVAKIFPPGSGDGSDALPAVWEQPEKFAAAVRRLEEKTAALRDAVAGGNRRDIATAFKAAGAACKGCHEDFRADDEDEQEHDD